MGIPSPIVVVTDLDGTLLDDRTYEAGAAADAVTTLQAAGVLVICCSAKTRVEQQVHREALGIRGPFIIENGAAVCADDDVLLRVFGLAYDDVRKRLAQTAAMLGVTTRGFGDMPVAELMERTGLPEAAAVRAKDREYTEPFVVTDADPSQHELADALDAVGLKLQRGARFWTAGGAHDKGLATGWLREQLVAGMGERPLIYGIGDAHNDAAMLAAVDVPYLVQRPGGVWADLEIDGMERIVGVGPQGWCQAADRILAASGA